MKLFTKYLLPFAIYFLFLKEITLGCSLFSQPQERLNPNEFVFLGEVLGIIAPVKIEGENEELNGLQVEVKEIISTPKNNKVKFNIYIFDLEPTCFDKPWSREKLEKLYPSGTKIRVIAEEDKSIHGNNSEINLSVNLYGSDGIWLNLVDGKALTDATSEFDYATFVEPVWDYKCCEESFKGIDDLDFNDWISYYEYQAKSSIPIFELRKDFVRLENAKSDKERIDILNRLKSYRSNKSSINLTAIEDYYIKGNRRNNDKKRQVISKTVASEIREIIFSFKAKVLDHDTQGALDYVVEKQKNNFRVVLNMYRDFFKQKHTNEDLEILSASETEVYATISITQGRWRSKLPFQLTKTNYGWKLYDKNIQ